MVFWNDIGLWIEKDHAISELFDYIKEAIEVMGDCYWESIVDINSENNWIPVKFDYDLTKMNMCSEKLMDILRKKPKHSSQFDIWVAWIDCRRWKHINAVYRIWLSLQENLVEILRKNSDISRDFADEMEVLSPWLAVMRFYHCIVRNMLISWSDKKISDFSPNECEIIMADPKGAYDYLKSHLTYNHRREYFDFEKLKENNVLHWRLNTFIYWLDDYFTMRDPGEEWYRKCSKESLWKFSRIITEKREKIWEGFFDEATREKDLEKLDYLKRRRKYAELVQFQWELSKRYFLNAYLEKGIITENYFDYLHNTKSSWEAIKELFYPPRTRKKADELMKEKKHAKNLAEEIQKTIDAILRYPPRQWYRLMRNLEMTVWSVNLVLLNQKNSGAGVRMSWLDELKFEIAEEWENVVIWDGKL